MAKVSIIIPIYDVEKYLRECLDSVISQTLTDIEIICVNDGSPDNCKTIIEEYAQKDKRIIVINKKNGGEGQACNVGLDTATGEYLAILEPDDYIEPQMYKDLYEIAVKNSLDIVKSCFYDNLQSKTLTRCKKTKWDDELIPKNTFTSYDCPLFLSYHPSIWSCIYKTEFIKANNIKFVEAKGAGWTDNPFQVQTMCLAKRINYTPNAYYYWHRLNENGADDLKDWTLPFKRSDEIHKWLEQNNINDSNILGCLYERELAYIQMVLDKKYSKEELKEVYEAINKMTQRMNLDVILKCEFINKRNRKKLLKVKQNLNAFYIKRKLGEFRKKILRIKFGRREAYIVFFGKTLYKKTSSKENLL